MQAHLKDFAAGRHETESFQICQRVLNQCHEMIYGDLPASGTPYSSLSLPSLPSLIRKKVKSNVAPALVGIGVVFAGVPAMPSLTEVMGEVAVEQGRMDSQGANLRSLDDPEGTVRTRSDSALDKSMEEDQEEDTSDPEESGHSLPTDDVDQLEKPSTATSRLGTGQSTKSGNRARSRSQTMTVQTSPALPLHLKDPRKPRLSEDPFGQNDSPLFASVASPSPFQSTPTFSGSRHLRRPNSLNSAETILQKYAPSSQTFLLRSHFCRSEVCDDTYARFVPSSTFQVQFLLALENICNRLLVVPKPARVSALRAELTGLNHMLPAEVTYFFPRDKIIF